MVVYARGAGAIPWGWVLAGALAACSGGDKASELVPGGPDDDASGADTPSADSEETPGAETDASIGGCDANTPLLSLPDGSTAVDVRTVPFAYDAARDLSLAPPFSVQIPEDVVSLTVTVDAGDDPSALALASIDGTLLVSLDDESDWADRGVSRHARGGQRRGPRSGKLVDTAWDSNDTWVWLSDTADTAWDSFWDTAYYGERSGWWTAPFYHGPAVGGTLVLPMSPGTAPFGGCLTLQAAVDGEAHGPGRVTVAVRRAPPEADALNLHLVVVEGAGINEAQLDALVDRMFAVYARGQALRRGVVTIFDLALPQGPFATPAEGMRALRASVTDSSDPLALRMFLIADFLGGGGILGEAGGIPGPLADPATGSSGVVVSIDGHRRGDGTLDVDTLAETMAHEAGHQMGLFHTSEANGQAFDILADTPECDAATYDRNADGQVTAGECRDVDGQNFMFWVSGGRNLDQGGVSASQAWVLDRTPGGRP
jgi:hypothetical protein